MQQFHALQKIGKQVCSSENLNDDSAECHDQEIQSTTSQSD
jgi:hypothetical protein